MTQTASHPLPAGQRLLVSIGVMTATLMQVLDQTIANVALPHMQASLGANQETIAWVLTSYIVAAAIATPVTGWLTGRFGRRQLFVVSTIGFTLSSMACGMAGSLPAMVAFRTLQGIFGAFLVPLSQSVMYDIYPREKHAQAMTIWSMGVMIGPIAGPVLGGWLTDIMDWRWVFFINVPFGIIAVILLLLLPEGEKENRKFDFIGFALLGLALSSFQLMLDRGAQLDWFDSWEIRIELGLAISAAWMFVVHTFTARDPLIQRSLFKDRNLLIALVFVMITSGVMIAGSVLLAPMLQRLMGYTATDAGLVTMPRGLAMMASMLIAGRIIRYFDPRAVIAFGLVISAYSLWMMAGFTLDMDQEPIILSGLVQGFGFGFVVLPLNLMAFSTLSARLRTDAAALYSLARSLGGSITISIVTALIARNVQINHSDLSSHFTSVTVPWLNTTIAQRLGGEGLSILHILDSEINRQALMIAYIDDFYLMFWATLLVLPLLAFMRRPKEIGNVEEAMNIAD